ncbi:hypothetical protein BT96DRAFT_944489 [Gymnopus androsaceus JB14]|uniref:Uncharacterized protein n=1 Tax=Gymnopus androsaceus JB14 TaxID=1447944 RepID=A0A6A4H313_9AGAR|nr:hypothetical protein BT96DRAFT_944489 [Gymnopus androsaceus JB14]
MSLDVLKHFGGRRPFRQLQIRAKTSPVAAPDKHPGRSNVKPAKIHSVTFLEAPTQMVTFSPPPPGREVPFILYSRIDRRCAEPLWECTQPSNLAKEILIYKPGPGRDHCDYEKRATTDSQGKKPELIEKLSSGRRGIDGKRTSTGGQFVNII